MIKAQSQWKILGYFFTCFLTFHQLSITANMASAPKPSTESATEPGGGALRYAGVHMRKHTLVMMQKITPKPGFCQISPQI